MHCINCLDRPRLGMANTASIGLVYAGPILHRQAQFMQGINCLDRPRLCRTYTAQIGLGNDGPILPRQVQVMQVIYWLDRSRLCRTYTGQIGLCYAGHILPRYVLRETHKKSTTMLIDEINSGNMFRLNSAKVTKAKKPIIVLERNSTSRIFFLNTSVSLRLFSFASLCTLLGFINFRLQPQR